jgi:hypothetical protein
MPRTLKTLTWTSDVPTQEGWYWFAQRPTVPYAGQESYDDELLYVFLHTDLHVLCAVQAEQCRPGRTRRPAFPLDIYVGLGSWAGPLHPPDPSPEMHAAAVDDAVPGPNVRQRQEL